MDCAEEEEKQGIEDKNRGLPFPAEKDQNTENYKAPGLESRKVIKTGSRPAYPGSKKNCGTDQGTATDKVGNFLVG